MIPSQIGKKNFSHTKNVQFTYVGRSYAELLPKETTNETRDERTSDERTGRMTNERRDETQHEQRTCVHTYVT